MTMPTKTKKAMQVYAQTLPPSTDRAQCYTIANYVLANGETIAERVARDHAHGAHAARAMRLMVEAGCAREVITREHYYGTFHFEDGSEFKG